MRDLNNLNREHDDKLKAQANSFPCGNCGIVYSEESGAYDGFICDDCKAHEKEKVNESLYESLWNNDKVQFARLINEMDLLGKFDEETIKELTDVTDLSFSEILDLIERAKNVYDETLEQLEGGLK
jgi:hypothetical protein